MLKEGIILLHYIYVISVAWEGEICRICVLEALRAECMLIRRIITAHGISGMYHFWQFKKREIHTIRRL